MSVFELSTRGRGGCSGIWTFCFPQLDDPDAEFTPVRLFVLPLLFSHG
jgi:hypothetical protein